MSVLHELDELLCGDDEEYDRLDLFHEADELIGRQRLAANDHHAALAVERGDAGQLRVAGGGQIDAGYLHAETVTDRRRLRNGAGGGVGGGSQGVGHGSAPGLGGDGGRRG